MPAESSHVKVARALVEDSILSLNPFFIFFPSHFSFLSPLLSFYIQLSQKNQSVLSFNFFCQFWSYSLNFYFFYFISLNIRLVHLFFDVKLGPYFLNFFYDFIFQYWVSWELSFIIFFNFLSIELSRYHDSSRGFGRLIWVNSNCFLGYFLNWICFSISYFNIGLVENWVLWFFYFLFMWLSQYRDPGRRLGKLTRVDLGNFLGYFLFVVFFSNSSINIRLVEI